jgi:hypothetical protein
MCAVPGSVTAGNSVYVYANASDTGNPASGMSTVSADLSSVASGQTGVSLSSGSYSYNGTSYGYRSGSVTLDSGVTAGTYNYSLKLKDSAGNSRTESGYTLTDATSYSQQVTNTATPFLYYRLGDSSGATATDSSGNGRNGTYNGGITLAATGALIGNSNTAATFNGSTGVVTNSNSDANPNTLTIEAWIKTTTTSGGKIVGFGNSSTTTDSTSYDRHIWMDNTGTVHFGVYYNSTKYVVDSLDYLNDGNWHFVAATLATDGIKLYVDGGLNASNSTPTAGQNFTGYWRVGEDHFGNWTPTPTSSFFSGTIDEVAIYHSELTAAQVRSQYSANTQLLTNPDFESGSSSGWTATSGVITNSASESAYSGSYYAWLGGYGSTHTDTLSQVVTIPANCTSATLAMWLRIDTSESSGTHDTMNLKVRNSTDTSTLATLNTWSNLDQEGYSIWSFDLSAYVGQTVTLKFTETDDNDGVVTDFVVDDMSLDLA